MATTFLEPGGDADFLVGTTNGFWGLKGSNPAVATDFVHGGHVNSIKYAPINSNSIYTPPGVLNDAGTRISFYIYLVALPTTIIDIFQGLNSGFSNVFRGRLTTAGVLQLFEATNQIGIDGATLSTGAWYRISLAYTITSTTVNRFELFVDGVSSISVTNATLTNTSSYRFAIGRVNGDVNGALDFRSSDHYIDNSNSLTDTGDIWVTAKRPVSNGATNNFTTQIGASGSGYGSGHSPQVNERPLSTTNGWSMIGAGAAVTEEYNIEADHVGDIDITGATIIDWLGWVSVKALAGTPTIQIILDGANNAQAISTTIKLYTKIKGSSTYPTGTGADIGIVTDTSITTESLYECGVIVAYIPEVATTTSTSSSTSTTSTSSSTSTSTTSTSSSTTSTSSSTSTTSTSSSTSTSTTSTSSSTSTSTTSTSTSTSRTTSTSTTSTSSSTSSSTSTTSTSSSTSSSTTSTSSSTSTSTTSTSSSTSSSTSTTSTSSSISTSTTSTSSSTSSSSSTSTTSTSSSTSSSSSSSTTTTLPGAYCSGPQSPGTMADDATVGTVAWSNPDNAKVSDNVYAFAALNSGITSHFLKATNFGFSIPAGATINGILVEVERKYDLQP